MTRNHTIDVTLWAAFAGCLTYVLYLAADPMYGVSGAVLSLSALQGAPGLLPALLGITLPASGLALFLRRRSAARTVAMVVGFTPVVVGLLYLSFFLLVVAMWSFGS